jgi:uncharacterized protein GlcG (DUF336 family)
MNVSRCLVLACAALLAIGGCRRHHDDSKAQTQRGIAATPQATPGAPVTGCRALPSANDLSKLLKNAPNDGEAGGIAGGRKEWAAIVDREGEICAVVVSTDDPAAAWPGSQGIARAKAYTANAFSTDAMPMSTARLYTMSQPGHSLWGAGAGNPLNPKCLLAPSDHDDGKTVCGGTITFGGGVPLYRGSTRVGGLGASGDTPCADHEIAKRVRDKAGLNPPGGPFADDITYAKEDGASVYTHPLCVNTYRNNKKIGEEAVASGY